MQLTVAIDFDGVLHPYTAGWQGPVPVDEPPAAETVEMLRWCREVGLRVVVFSTRAKDHEGRTGIFDWLDVYDLAVFVDEITVEKPPAIAYIDDRAVTFRRDVDPAAAWTEAKGGLLELLRADGRWQEPPTTWYLADCQDCDGLPQPFRVESDRARWVEVHGQLGHRIETREEVR